MEDDGLEVISNLDDELSLYKVRYQFAGLEGTNFGLIICRF